ncbi:MAG: DegQ family serine endoprotease [Casimicrobiaceae bacterium]
MQSKSLKRSVVALAVAGAFATGTLVAERHGFSPADAAVTPPVVAPSRAVVGGAPAAALPDFADLVQKHGPAVVQISVTGSLKKAAAKGGMPFGDDEDSNPLAPFFRGMPMPQQPQQPRQMQGMGSGFIVSNDGVILTNAHVVANADEVTVRLTDHREYKAKVLGTDKRTDIAVLKVEAKDLPTVHTGSSEKARVGEWVIAIGAPFGLDNTVTSGIISAKGRTLPGDSYVPFIQTDAAVNPGNSGGPLFNMNGEVIGINSQIFSRSGGFQGLAFAVPIDVALNVKDQILKTGKVQHGLLGVTIQEVNAQLAENFGLKQPGGALVSSVQKDGPGAKAGLKPGDVILKFNGKSINRSGELPPLVASLSPGTSVPLEVWREGKPISVTTTVGTLDAEKAVVAKNEKDEAATGGKLGVAVRPLTADEKKSGDMANGVVIENVGGPAAKAGLQPGDVILSINSTPVNSVDELRAIIDKAGKTVAILVQRDEARIFVPVTIG